VTLNLLCSSWLSLRTHMSEELFACSKTEWDLRDPNTNHNQYIRDGVWFVRDVDKEGKISWSMFVLFTKNERKKHGFKRVEKTTKDPIEIILSLRGVWKPVAEQYPGMKELLTMFPSAFHHFFGYSLGGEKRNYSSCVSKDGGKKILLCHSLPNPAFSKTSLQFLQYDCDPHDGDCYVDVDNTAMLESVGFKGSKPSVDVQKAMCEVEYSVNGETKTGISLVNHPPSARKLHGVMKANEGCRVKKLLQYAQQLVQGVRITTKDVRLSSGERFSSNEAEGFGFLVKALVEDELVQLDYRFFGRKHYLGSLRSAHKLAERDLPKRNHYTAYTKDEYESKRKAQSTRTDGIVERNYTEVVTRYGFPEWQDILNSSTDTLRWVKRVKNGGTRVKWELTGYPSYLVAPGSLTLNDCHSDLSQLNFHNQVKACKWCDQIAMNFELIDDYEYDHQHNPDVLKNAAYRQFKEKLYSIAPERPTYAEQMLESGKQMVTSGINAIKRSPKRVRQAWCGESPSSSDFSSDEEPDRKRLKPS
jgi:hypothetical protein